MMAGVGPAAALAVQQLGIECRRQSLLLETVEVAAGTYWPRYDLKVDLP
jgi:hypothetical protein